MSYFNDATTFGMTTSYTGNPTSFTDFAWVKKAGSSPDTQGCIIGKIVTGGVYGYSRGVITDGSSGTQGGPGMHIDHSAALSYSSPASQNYDLSGWVPIVWTFGGSGHPAMYIGNNTAISLADWQDASGTLAGGSNPYTLFRHADAQRRFNGYIAHAGKVGRVWSSTEISAFMNGRNPMDLTNFTGGAPDLFYNMMTNGLGTSDSGGTTGLGTNSGIKNAQVGSLTNDGSTLFNADNPTVDAPPAAGVTLAVFAQYRLRQMGA